MVKYKFPKECADKGCDIHRKHTVVKVKGELKPCPFCSPAESNPKMCNDFDVDFWVECSNCESHSSFFATSAQAAEAWNRRGGVV